MIYEMRIYRCVPGRLPALLQRFEKVTLHLWKNTEFAKPASGPP